VRAYVVDRRGVPTPFGAPGELLIAGPAVSAGYPGRPDDAERGFPPEPGRPGRRMYRTGDQVRLLDDGAAVFEGRGDGQVKVRGYRVEIGEIEERLRSDPAVGQAAVTAADDELVGYLVAASGAHLDAEAVRDRLAARVPQQFVPTRLVVLERFPLTPSGKLDRRRLREEERPAPVRAVREPRTETEAELVSIWTEVLNLPAVGVDDDFFRIGGHSLVATKAIARCRTRFGIDLPLHVIFAHPTIEAIAAEIDERRSRTAEDLTGLLDELDALTDEEAALLLESEPLRTGDDL
jgi:hypothetical protein